MIRKLSMIATVVAAFALPAAARGTDVDSTYCDPSSIKSPAHGDTDQDTMYCDGRRMIVESECHICVARCGDQVANNTGLSPVDAENTFGTCAGTCQDALDVALDRVDHSPRCDGIIEPPPPPDPERCTAQLMRADARNMLCHSRCMKRGKSDRCGEVCDNRLHAGQDRICAKDVCEKGPAAPLPKDLCTRDVAP